MEITEQCQNGGCDGDVKFRLGPHRAVEESQVVEGKCSACGETYTLRTNLNRKIR